MRTRTILALIFCLTLALAQENSGPSPSSVTATISGAIPAGGNTIGAVTQASGPWTSNITQFGGNAVVTGTGASGVGIPRVTLSNDSSLAANQSINAAQIGGVATAASAALADAVANPTVGSFGSYNIGFNGTTWDRLRSTSLANFPTSATTTTRNEIGIIQVEKGSRWSVVSNPSSGTQATASIAAEASVRHVADCITWSALASAATVASEMAVNLRDGATGAGTIRWTVEMGAPVLAAGGMFSNPGQICGLNIVGTTNTAMTFEFNAGLTGLIESVSITGYNVN